MVGDVLLDLPSMGSRVGQRDLFVHVDRSPGEMTAGDPYLQMAISELIYAFDRLEIERRGEDTSVGDGKGIVLHLDAGASSVMDPTVAPWREWGDQSLSGLAGMTEERDEKNRPAIWQLPSLAPEAEYLRSGRGGGLGVPPIFKYLCLCDAPEDASTTSGLAEGSGVTAVMWEPSVWAEKASTYDGPNFEFPELGQLRAW